MTRILHTSDWHLGASLEGVSRDADHTLFLDWLSTTLRDERIDVLVVAGDVFDQAQPSAEAQRLYYRFLSRTAGDLRRIVVVGGNHDSASRLDAPRDVLSSLSIHVVGGMSADRSTWDRCLCRIEGEQGGASCVIAAVPFVHEFRLGVRTALRPEGEIRQAFTEAFRSLYQELADRAERAGAGAPMIATGHLAAEGADRKDAPAEVHMIGSIGALSSSIFDPRFQYVALGHVHRSYHVKDSRAWYCGSPVPLDVTEASPRRVLIYDTQEANGEPIALQVPSFRMVTKLRGPLDQVTESLRSLSWDSPLPPFVYVEVEVEGYTAGVDDEIVKAAADQARKGLKLLVTKQVRLARPGDGAVAPAPRLADLTPEQVFVRLCEARGQVADDRLLAAFRSLLSSADEGEAS